MFDVLSKTEPSGVDRSVPSTTPWGGEVADDDVGYFRQLTPGLGSCYRVDGVLSGTCLFVDNHILGLHARRTIYENGKRRFLSGSKVLNPFGLVEQNCPYEHCARAKGLQTDDTGQVPTSTNR